MKRRSSLIFIKVSQKFREIIAIFAKDVKSHSLYISRTRGSIVFRSQLLRFNRKLFKK